MKSQTYLRLSLLIPYLLWVISLGIIFVTSQFPESNNVIITIISGVAGFYTLGVILWGIPYTLLAVGLWVWSRSRDTRKMARGFAYSPILLGLLLMIETFILSINWSDVPNGFSQISPDFTASILTLGGLSLLYGYLCIGFAAGLYKLLKKFNVINDEEPKPSPVMLEQPTS